MKNANQALNLASNTKMQMYILKTLFKGCPTGHKDFQRENTSVTEKHIHINEAETTTGELRHSRVEKEDEGQRTPGCSGTSSYTDTDQLHQRNLRELRAQLG